MHNPDRYKKILEYVQLHKLAVLSSVTRDFKPESAVIGISVNEDFEVLFGTFDTSRKVHNFETNINVSLVIGWEYGKTVQLEGVVESLTTEEVILLKQSGFAHMPTLTKYIAEERTKYYKVKPRWVRFSDFSIEPWERIELNFH